MSHVPYSLMQIKPLSVGRGQGPLILTDILDMAPVTLRSFRQWRPCPTTLHALYPDPKIAEAHSMLHEKGAHKKNTWVCLFTHVDRVTDPHPFLEAILGDHQVSRKKPGTLRYKYWDGNFSPHITDTVVDLSSPARVDLEASLLLRKFDPARI